MLVIQLIGKEYKAIRFDEIYGGYQDGYRTSWQILQNRKKGDPLTSFITLSFSTGAAVYDQKDPDRLYIGVSGGTRTHITQPKEYRWDRWVDRIEKSFARDRKLQHIANGIAGAVTVIRRQYDGLVKEATEAIKAHADFAKRVDGIIAENGIRKRDIFRSGFGLHDGEVQLEIRSTKARKASVVIKVTLRNNRTDIKIDDLSREKLAEITAIIRR